MSTNISKKKRDDLIKKIKEIRKYIGYSVKDTNSDNLLNYINEIEKELKSKKFGLIFEEHKEKIDEILETHTPVLTEDKSLFIDNGGQMNFLIEGDNLAALQLLEKTHKGKIDLIYIDPPYNTGNKDFIYDDDYVDENDEYRHSKWLSFIEKRLKLARNLITKKGIIAISIGHHEINHLIVLCDSLFPNKQITTVTVQTSGGKPSSGFNYLHEYIVFIAPYDFQPNQSLFAGGNTRSPFEGLTLSTFDKTQRPNQAYPIFISEKSGQIIGTGLSLTDRVNNGMYKGNLADFKFDFNEAPEGAVAIWPYSSKGIECVWRLISTRLLDDWKKGYIKVSKNKSSLNPNKYSVQYLPEGVIQKIKNKDLEIIGTEDGMPTLKFGENKTEGSEIPTIWTEKSFYTTKGTSLLREIFNDKSFNKVFPYPKSLELISEIIRTTSPKDGIILDFFAGSGTTGHSVIKLNSESDGSQRRFILCTNNQNDICRSITYKRLKTIILEHDASAETETLLFSQKLSPSILSKMDTVIEKTENIIQENNKKYDSIKCVVDDNCIKLKGITSQNYIKKYNASLKYYKIDYLPISDKLYYEYADELLKHIRELVELENGINFTGNAKIAIILTDEELADFIRHIDDFKKCRKIYLGHDVLTDGEQEQIFKDRKITINVIPDYYYRELEN